MKVKINKKSFAYVFAICDNYNTIGIITDTFPILVKHKKQSAAVITFLVLYS